MQVRADNDDYIDAVFNAGLLSIDEPIPDYFDLISTVPVLKAIQDKEKAACQRTTLIS